MQSCKVAKLRVGGVQWCKVTKLQGCKVARVQGCKGARVQGCKNARMQGCKGARVQGCKGAFGYLPPAWGVEPFLVIESPEARSSFEVLFSLTSTPNEQKSITRLQIVCN